MSATAPVIVNHAQISRAIGGGTGEAVATAADGLAPDDEAVLGRALTALEDTTGDADVLHSPDDQAAALLQTFLAERILEGDNFTNAPGGAVEAQFDRKDLLGWMRTAIPYIRTRLGVAKRDPRPPMPTTTEAIPDHCRVALLGDWGTGLYGARPIAQTIAREADYDLLLHLGDVYYSGSEHEIQYRFLDIWQLMTMAMPAAISRACNSNHEMFSGGGPYYTQTLHTLRQSSPVFILENQYWVILGLDTAYNDHDLDTDQLEVIRSTIAKLSGRRLILLSHHQPFSRLSGQGPRLVKWLRPILDQQVAFAWYWGHEHRLALYDKHPSWGLYGRCVGHGGMPYDRAAFQGASRIRLADEQLFRVLPGTRNAPVARILDGPNDYLADKREKYGPHGFVRLELVQSRLYESVVTPGGIVLWEAELR